jgi:hypothetical protein
MGDWIKNLFQRLAGPRSSKKLPAFAAATMLVAVGVLIGLIFRNIMTTAADDPLTRFLANGVVASALISALVAIPVIFFISLRVLGAQASRTVSKAGAEKEDYYLKRDLTRKVRKIVKDTPDSEIAKALSRSATDSALISEVISQRALPRPAGDVVDSRGNSENP